MAMPSAASKARASVLGQEDLLRSILARVEPPVRVCGAQGRARGDRRHRRTNSAACVCRLWRRVVRGLPWELVFTAGCQLSAGLLAGLTPRLTGRPPRAVTLNMTNGCTNPACERLLRACGPALRSLTLALCNAPFVLAIAGLPGLTHLDLSIVKPHKRHRMGSGRKFEGKVAHILPRLRDLQGLRSLSLTVREFGKQPGLGWLRALPHLTRLQVHGCKPVAGLPALQLLVVKGVKGDRVQQHRLLDWASPHITELKFKWAVLGSLTEAPLAHPLPRFTGLPCLQRLEFEGCGVECEGQAMRDAFPRLTHLRFRNLKEGSVVSGVAPHLLGPVCGCCQAGPIVCLASDT